MSELFNTPRRVKRGWMNMRVDKIIDDTHDTKTFILVDADEGGRPFDYVAGQYLTFRFDAITDKPIVRSYTMSSSPNQSGCSGFTVKRVDTGVISNWLCNHIKVGDILRGRGPIGRFCYDPSQDRKHLFMIAAGSGVTPFLSIMRDHAPTIGKPGSPEKMTLLVSYRSSKDIIGQDLFEEFKKLNNPNIKVHTTLSREDLKSKGFLYGRIDTNMIAGVIPTPASMATYMLCGPVEMMNLGKAMLLERHVPEMHVKIEDFAS